MINVQRIKQDFPIFKNSPHLVYLDSASTSLKPRPVIDKLVEYYEKYPANVKRGIYKMSERATEEYEGTRAIVADFINARDTKEVIFTRGTTESINLVAYGLGRKIVNAQDEIVVSVMEHHSNFVPWQQLSFEVGADFKVIDIDEEGKLPNLEEVITKRTKILALTYVSNVLGTINPIKKITQTARLINPRIVIIVDGAQAVPHMGVDVADLGCDFLAFSGHKMLGPTGVGVLWGKRKLLEDMFPFQYGGEMIYEVQIEKTIFAEPPEKFEAGTPSIADVVAFKEAIRYLKNIGFKKIRRHEEELSQYTIERLNEEFDREIKIFGPRSTLDRGGIVAFSFPHIHPHDIATILDDREVCVRAGHHCAMPLHQRLELTSSCRVSFYLYNSEEDVDIFINALKKSLSILSKTTG